MRIVLLKIKGWCVVVISFFVGPSFRQLISANSSAAVYTGN